MTQAASLDPMHDPHCGRSAHERIGFTVKGQSWDVEWGSHDVFGTPAFWVNRTAIERYEERLAERASDTGIVSAVLFGLLGGAGVKAESASAAKRAVLDLLAENPAATAEEIEKRLSEPLPGGLGCYRFPKQRSERIVVSLAQLRSEPPPENPIELEMYLGRMYGVGPPTAARIVRNLTGSAKVAIISGPLVRAMTWTGIFKPQWHLRRHYDRFRESFLQYAAYGNVQPGALDLCIWEKARSVEPSHFSLG